MKALIEKKNALLDEADALINKAKTENRAFEDSELNRYNEIKAELARLNKTISAVKETRETEIDEPDNKKNSTEEAETRLFEAYIRNPKAVETRADTNLTFGANGAIIPTSIENKIIDKVKEICPIFELATKYNVGGTLTIPYIDTDTSDNKMAYATEFTELESTSTSFKSISLTGFLAATLCKISKSLINNSQFDIVSYTIQHMAVNIAQWIEGQLLNGTSGKIEGLSGVTQSVTTASATAITGDELIDLQESIPDVYQNGAVWIMAKSTRTKIRKLKDGEGNYLLQRDFTAPARYILLGKPVYISDNMPNMAAGKTAIFYGDMSGLAVKITEGSQFNVYTEKYGTQHAIGIDCWLEMDAKVENAQKISTGVCCNKMVCERMAGNKEILLGKNMKMLTNYLPRAWIEINNLNRKSIIESLIFILQVAIRSCTLIFGNCWNL